MAVLLYSLLKVREGANETSIAVDVASALKVSSFDCTSELSRMVAVLFKSQHLETSEGRSLNLRMTRLALLHSFGYMKKRADAESQDLDGRQNLEMVIYRTAAMQACEPSRGVTADNDCRSGFTCCDLSCARQLSRADLLVCKKKVTCTAIHTKSSVSQLNLWG